MMRTIPARLKSCSSKVNEMLTSCSRQIGEMGERQDVALAAGVAEPASSFSGAARHSVRLTVRFPAAGADSACGHPCGFVKQLTHRPQGLLRRCGGEVVMGGGLNFLLTRSVIGE